MDYETAYRQLSEHYSLLEEQFKQLQKAIIPRMRFPREWRLTSAEKRVLASLYSSKDGYRSKELLIFALDAKDRGGTCARYDSNLSVRICSIRRKLQPYGIKIDIRRNEGFFLTRESAAIIRHGVDEENKVWVPMMNERDRRRFAQ